MNKNEGEKTMNGTKKTSRWPPMQWTTKIEKGGMGKGGWVVSSRSFDRLNSMMNDLKRSVDLRGLFDHRCSGLHKLWYPSIRDTSTWSKFGAHGEHGDVFLFFNSGALWFSENLIRYSLHICLREVKNNFFSFKHSYLRHFSWRF